MSVFNNPSKIISNILGWFSGASTNILEFLRPTIKMLQRDGRTALMGFAMKAVAEMEATNLSNAIKRDSALNAIRTAAFAAGIAFVEREVRAILELALIALKEKE